MKYVDVFRIFIDDLLEIIQTGKVLPVKNLNI